LPKIKNPSARWRGKLYSASDTVFFPRATARKLSGSARKRHPLSPFSTSSCPSWGAGHSREAPCSVRQSADFVHPRLFARLQQRRPRCYRRALPAKALQPHHTRPDRSGNSRRGQKPRTSAVSARLPETDEPSFFHSVSPRLASISFFAVDTCVSQCYKPEKDKPLGGESPNVLPIAVRE